VDQPQRGIVAFLADSFDNDFADSTSAGTSHMYSCISIEISASSYLTTPC